MYKIIDKYWKILLWIPIVLLISSTVIIANNVIATGSFMKRGVELTGGTSLTFEIASADVASIRSEIPFASVRETHGAVRNLVVEFPSDEDASRVEEIVSSHASVIGEPTLRTTGPSIGEIFFNQAQIALILAFVFMAVTVFILFRSVVPSSIVVLAAATDIIVTIAVLSLLDVSLSLPVIAALLTLIGYSVDTDLLLTYELLKGPHSEIGSGIRRAMRTGLTMTVTTLVALFAMFIMSGSFVIEQIALVLLIGLLVDIPATWFTNVGILRFWMERRQRT